MAQKKAGTKRRKSPRALYNRITKVESSLDEVERCVEDLKLLTQMNRLFTAGMACAADALDRTMDNAEEQSVAVERDYLMVA